MALSGLDHFILARRHTENQHFLANLEGSVNDLRGRLADKTASVEAYKAVFDTLLDAYEAGDYDAVSKLLENTDERNRIYKAVYNSVHDQMS